MAFLAQREKGTETYSFKIQNFMDFLASDNTDFSQVCQLQISLNNMFIQGEVVYWIDRLTSDFMRVDDKIFVLF